MSGQVRCMALYVANICAVFIYTWCFSVQKLLHMHFKSDFLHVLCNSFKARLKIWTNFKTTDQVSFSEQMPHSFTGWFSLP